MLDGSAGGLHAVRALLLMTPEWNAKGAREALVRRASCVACPRFRAETLARAQAAAQEAAGDSQRLAPVLRAKTSSKLNKGQLMQLCAAWGYAHHSFRAKGELVRKRPRARTAADASTSPPAAASSGSRLPQSAPPTAVPRVADSMLLDAFDAASVAQFMAGPLGAIQHVCSGALEGPRARSAVETHRVPHCSSTALEHYRIVSAACGAATAKLAELQGAQAVWANAASKASSSGSRSAVWLTLPMLGGTAPAEAALDMLRGGFGLARRLHCDVQSDLRDALPGGVNPVLKLACDELLDGISAGLRFVVALEAALAAGRLQADMPHYVALCDATLACCTRFMVSIQAAFMMRAAWSQRVLEPGFCSTAPYSLPSATQHAATFCVSFQSLGTKC